MQQFRSLPAFQPTNAVEMSEEQENISNAPTSPVSTPSLLVFPRVITEQLPPISGAKITGTLSLLDALQSAISPDTGERERVVVIPGSKKREQPPEEKMLKRRMSPRLRQSIIVSTILFVIITTFTSLAPLANGQSSVPIFKSISAWVQVQQLNWQIQSHFTTIGQNNPGTLQTAPPPPMIQNNPPAMYLPTSQYIAIAEQDALDAGISPNYFVRQINQESSFNPNAVSPSGAVGVAQFLPSTAAGLGINPWNPIEALRGAARLMASYAQNYGGDYAKALAAYNAGSGTVQYAVNSCGGNWMNCLPAETRHYIYVIMGI